MQPMSDETRAERTMCPLLTCAAGKSRPCAGARCEWWVESFDPRYSSCAVLSIASATHKTMGIQKAIVRGIAQGGGI